MNDTPKKMRRSPWRLIGKTIGFGTVFLLAVLAAGLLYVNSKPGQKQLISWLNIQLEQEDSRIIISPVKGSLYSGFSIDNIVIEDRKGPWLDLQQLELHWSPFDLFRRSLTLSHASVGTLEVIRRPLKTTKTSDKNTPIALFPSLPLDIEVSDLSVQDIQINRTVFGMSAKFTGQGALSVTRSGGFRSQATLLNKGKSQDKISANIIYPGAGGVLSADLLLNAPKGGLLTRIIGTGPDHDISATLVGTGPIENWQGEFQMRVDDNIIAKATLRHIDHSLTLRGQLDAGNFIADREAALLGRKATLNLDITPTERYDQAALSLDIIADSLKFSAHGIVVTEDIGAADQVDFSFEIMDSKPFNKIFEPAHIKPGTVKGVIRNLTRNPSITLMTEQFFAGFSDDISTNFSGKIEAQTVAQGFSFSALGRLDDITGHHVGPYKALVSDGFNWAISGKVDTKNTTTSLTNFSIENDQFKSGGTGQFDTTNGALSARLMTSLQSLTHLVPTLSGKLDMTAEVTQADNSAPLHIQIMSGAEGLNLADDIANDVIGSTPNFNASLTRTKEGAITLEQATVTARHLTLTAQAEITPENIIIQSAFDLTLSDLTTLNSLKDLQLEGEVGITGMLSGALSSPDISLEGDLKQLAMQDVRFENIVAKMVAQNIIAAPEGNVAISGDSNFGALRGKADFTLKKIPKLSALDFSLGAYHVTGHLDLLPGAPVIGQITLLTDPAVPQGNAIKGDIAAKVQLNDQNGQQHITADGQIEDLTVHTSQNDIITLQSGTLSTAIIWGDGEPDMTLNAHLTRLSHPRFQVKEGQITLKQADRDIIYDVHFLGTDSMPYDLNVSGKTSPPVDDTRLIAVNLEGSIDHKAIRLEDPVTLSLSQTGFSLSPFKVTLEDGNIAGKVKVHNTDIEAKITAHKADLSPLGLFIPEIPLTGLLSGDLSLLASPQSIKGAFDLSLSNLMVTDNIAPLNPKVVLSLKGDVSKDSIRLVAKGKLENKFLAQLSAKLPLQIEMASSTVSLPNDQPITGEMSVKGDIDHIWPAFNLISHELKGTTDSTIIIGGTLENPDLDGYVKVKNGQYESLKIGFVATDIDMAATIVDRRLTLDHLTANDGEEGRITAQGDIRLYPDLRYDAKAELDISQARLIRQPELNVTASTHLSFLKNARQSYLKGDVTVNNANVGAITQGAAAIPALDVREINHPTNNQPQNKDAGLHIGPVPLDLTLQVPGKLFIRSYGIDSEWKADMTIMGTSEKPILSGSASLIRGLFEFSGKKFTLTKGLLTFSNDKSNDPQVNISAEHKLTDLTALLTISGWASAPKLSVSSSPHLPQDEVLSRILFGTSVTELSALEALQLASAVHSLSNGGGSGLMGGIRNSLGIDRLSIDNSDSRDYGTTITGGKYLTNNIYVEVTTAPATGETATSVEVNLTRDLSLTTRQTMSRGKNLALRWSWKY